MVRLIKRCVLLDIIQGLEQQVALLVLQGHILVGVFKAALLAVREVILALEQAVVQVVRLDITLLRVQAVVHNVVQELMHQQAHQVAALVLVDIIHQQGQVHVLHVQLHGHIVRRVPPAGVVRARVGMKYQAVHA